MKRRVIIFSTILAIISLLVVSFTNSNTTNIDEAKSSDSNMFALESKNIKRVTNKIPDLYYGVDTRFAAIKKSDVHNATTIYDFLNEGEKKQIAHINAVELIIVENNQLSEKRAYGENEYLTDAQIKLLKATEYFSHFTIRTEFKATNNETGKLEERFFGPHITVVPNKQAAYINGENALIKYLKDNSKEDMHVIKGDKLGAIKISFTITKEGIVSNVKHDAMTTGYPSIDKKLIQLIKNIPGQWTPAENTRGEKMDQELVFTFGPKNGC
ncbi:hypothetical protein [Psychroserpens luteolus]|uniref:hypothetical protein n=1 Tax=Psychroserpens luteolus TaxID=2855840 RepID=UPI001E286EE5|nr:hypothetical protein [Psychroserpens luteolus]MCD2260047.1 hypothetical protein [Psychroserpens luteolus]